jgi:hypothetical protein
MSFVSTLTTGLGVKNNEKKSKEIDVRTKDSFARYPFSSFFLPLLLVHIHVTTF